MYLTIGMMLLSLLTINEFSLKWYNKATDDDK
jgi:hypothetical protein